jgi:PPOX class probable F420-dependent enzyme
MELTEARKTFRDARVAHVATTLPTGEPHVVPLWFVWVEDGLFLSSRRSSRVWRNLLRDPRVAVQIERGRAWTEQAGVLIQGAGEPVAPDHPSGKQALSAWFDKYRSELDGNDFAAYTEQVREPVLIRVRPERFTTWIHARAAAR